MEKFKIGDKVQVKNVEGLTFGTNSFFTPNMVMYRGLETEVVGIDDDGDIRLADAEPWMSFDVEWVERIGA